MTPHRLERDARARIQYTDVVLGFATLVTFIAVAPWVYTNIGMAQNAVDPLSATLLALTLPFFVIAMIVSLGVSAKSN